MKRVTDKFDDQWINILIDGTKVYFNEAESAKAAGYKTTSGLTYHTGKARYILGDERFVDIRQINKAAMKANRNLKIRFFAQWANALVTRIKAQEDAAAHIAKQTKPEATPWPFPPVTVRSEFTLKEVADKVGMSHSEFITWMSTEGYLETYKSNGHLKMTVWFRTNGFGVNPLAESGRISNTIRITQKGVDFIKNRLASSREKSVLAFANSEAVYREKTEKEVSELIDKTFSEFKYNSDYSGLSQYLEYRMDNAELQRAVRAVMAQCMLKEKQ